MHRPEVFRHRLSQRILALMALIAPATLMFETGCDPYAGCGDQTVNTNQCFAWPANGGSGGAGTTGSGGAGGAAGAGGAGGGMPVMCPSREEAKPMLDANFYTPVSVQSDGVLGNGQCCYDVTYTEQCIGGRPFIVDEQPRVALIQARTYDPQWSVAPNLSPDVSSLSADERAELATAWARDGAFEHASVASFSRFALELMAVGAPPELISAAHAAAMDEVRHAKLCLTLASHYAGSVLEPAPFPFDGRVAVSSDLVDLAMRVTNEGAIGETISAVIASEQLAHAQDPAVRDALAVIAEDEARHAELAFRTLAWAIRVGGRDVAEAISNAFVQAMRDIDVSGASENPALAAHGRLDAATLRRAAKRGMDEVLRPAMSALRLSLTHKEHFRPAIS